MAKENMFVIVCERDHEDLLKSGGAIIFETYTRDASLSAAKDRAEGIGDRYGKIRFFKLTEVDFDGEEI